MSTAPVAVVEPQSEYAICEHVKDNGVRCGSPALRVRHFCYHHSRAHYPAGRLGERGYRAPLPETIESLQLQLQQIAEALGSGRLTPQAAGKLLYSVQLSTNLLKMKQSAGAVGTPFKSSADTNEKVFGAPFKPSGGLSGVVPPVDDPNDHSNLESQITVSPSSDHQIARSSDCVTELPASMEESLSPRPLTEEEQQNPNAPCPTDPDMPQTIEEAHRAVLDPERYVAMMDALGKCDRLSSRYAKIARRIDIHREAFKILCDAGILSSDAFCEGLTIIANQRERKQKKI